MKFIFKFSLISNFSRKILDVTERKYSNINTQVLDKFRGKFYYELSHWNQLNKQKIESSIQMMNNFLSNSNSITTIPSLKAQNKKVFIRGNLIKMILFEKYYFNKENGIPLKSINSKNKSTPEGFLTLIPHTQNYIDIFKYRLDYRGIRYLSRALNFIHSRRLANKLIQKRILINFDEIGKTEIAIIIPETKSKNIFENIFTFSEVCLQKTCVCRNKTHSNLLSLDSNKLISRDKAKKNISLNFFLLPLGSTVSSGIAADFANQYFAFLNSNQQNSALCDNMIIVVNNRGINTDDSDPLNTSTCYDLYQIIVIILNSLLTKEYTNIENINLIGYSMGAYAALKFIESKFNFVNCPLGLISKVFSISPPYSFSDSLIYSPYLSLISLHYSFYNSCISKSHYSEFKHSKSIFDKFDPFYFMDKLSRTYFGYQQRGLSDYSKFSNILDENLEYIDKQSNYEVLSLNNYSQPMSYKGLDKIVILQSENDFLVQQNNMYEEILFKKYEEKLTIITTKDFHHISFVSFHRSESNDSKPAYKEEEEEEEYQEQNKNTIWSNTMVVNQILRDKF